jgi:hypothetical protein
MQRLLEVLHLVGLLRALQISSLALLPQPRRLLFVQLTQTLHALLVISLEVLQQSLEAHDFVGLLRARVGLVTEAALGFVLLAAELVTLGLLLLEQGVGLVELTTQARDFLLEFLQTGVLRLGVDLLLLLFRQPPSEVLIRVLE